jgi:hypothetical protein
MDAQTKRALEALASEIRGHANIADGPGQYEALHRIANRLTAIARKGGAS